MRAYCKYKTNLHVVDIYKLHFLALDMNQFLCRNVHGNTFIAQTQQNGDCNDCIVHKQLE